MYEQEEDEAGYLFYVNKKTGERQNDNPKLVEIMNTIKKEYKSIKYIIYRCASKVWLLKQIFYTVNIPYHIVLSILDRHRLNQTDIAPTIRPLQLISILHDIYFAADKYGCFSQSVDFELERCTSILANFIWCIFDPHRKVPISLLELRQLLLILCNTNNFDQLIMEEFAITCDHNRCVNRFRFESVMKVISKFFSHLDEHEYYGSHLIPQIVNECFEQCPGIIGLNEFQFASLWRNQSITFAYISNVLTLVKRIKESQTIIHEIQCASCKSTSIQGIRFKCQQCRNVSLCFECFCSGYSSSKHKYSHRMYEISTNKVKTSSCCSIFTKMCKFFITDSDSNNNITMETKVVGDQNTEDVTTTIECINDTKFQSIRSAKQLKDHLELPPAKPDNQLLFNHLNTIIDSLVDQSDKVNAYLVHNDAKKEKRKTKDKELDKMFIHQHKDFLLEVIKQLQDICAIQVVNDVAGPHASTPYRDCGDIKKILRRPRSIINSPMIDSIRGAEINRSFLENNKSDLSVADVSTWIHMKSRSNVGLDVLKEESRNCYTSSDTLASSLETNIQNFRSLITKVKEIMDDSFSDNAELSLATHKLERVLDDIICAAEEKRTYL